MDYSAQVIEHFEHPRNVSAGPSPTALTGRAGSLRSGSLIEFQVEMAGEVIDRVTFRARGCPHTIAVASWLTGILPGQRLAETLPLGCERVADVLGLPAGKWHCVLTAEDALRAVQEKVGT